MQVRRAEAKCPRQRRRNQLRPKGKSAGHHHGWLDGLEGWPAGAVVPDLRPGTSRCAHPGNRARPTGLRVALLRPPTSVTSRIARRKLA
jgi:hypothetical protein